MYRDSLAEQLMPSKQQQAHALGVRDALTLLHVITTEEAAVMHEHSDMVSKVTPYPSPTSASNYCIKGIPTC